MFSGFFKSVVNTTHALKTVHFRDDKGSESFDRLVAAASPDLKNGSSYYVNPLLSSGHAQTAYSAVNRFDEIDQIYYLRRIFTIESDKKSYEVNGDLMPYDRWNGRSTIALDYVVDKSKCIGDQDMFRPESQIRQLPPRTEYIDSAMEQTLFDNEKPLVIALHGLAGGSYESYLRTFLHEITGPEHNFDGMVLNARGCAHHTITSPQLFCGLWTNDLRYLINEHISKKWPNKQIFLIGFSLGGSILANYLGQEGDHVYKNIKGAATMSCPWDFPQSSTALVESYLGQKVYSPAMCRNLLRLLDKHYDSSLHVNEIIAEYKENPEKFHLKTLRDFDEAFTSKLFGFNCAEEYYRHASPSQRLLNVRAPLLIFNSKDDPIVGSKNLPHTEIKMNPYVYMVETSIGGHLGWFNIRNQRWYSKPLSRVFAAMAKCDIESVPLELLHRASDGNWKHDRIIQ
ncbi:AB-hydrolase YheT [Metschnikowia bicuspidata]|uniref:AB-hydrolase YheT n=1 Tax=Metschnikowia bicuspidata TaxID=27322 RepID=A0A4P9Z9Y7_9ASCO|nr:AB-hydrolase YheT [Metschnikowia bicuspidata]